MRRFLWLPILAVAGCGGTNTTDGAQPYNRSAGSYNETPIAPGVSGFAKEIASVNAVINATEVKDAKEVNRVVGAMKRLPIPPKRLFLLGVDAKSAEWWKKPLEDAKIAPIPVVGASAEGWDKVIKSLGVSKLMSTGPKNTGVNPEGLKADQTALCASMAADGVRFVVVNTDTPLKGDKPGQIPPIWLKSNLENAKENSVVVLGWRAFAPLGEKDPTPALETEEPTALLGKSTKVRAWVSSSASAPLAKRLLEKGPIQLAVGGGIGEDKLPFVGLIEVKKSGAINARMVKLVETGLATSSLEASLWEPAPPTPTKGKPADGPTKPKGESKL